MATFQMIRDIPPCKGCPDRYTACSDHCQKPEFLKWREKLETVRTNRQAGRIIDSYQADEIRKNRRMR